MFQQARNFTINGGQFTIAENGQDAVSTILWQHVAAGAIFDSAERYPPGKCHQQTRRKVIDQMTTWIKDANPPQRVLWMCGPAGSGKSALMQSLCEILRDSYPGLKGGSFFFAKGHMVRGNAKTLFVTLAYQLAIQFPALRAAINDALSQDPSLPTKSMDIQLRALIIDPLLRCQELPSTTTPTLFIDGLDECDSQRTQRQIITLISKSVFEHDIPIRFIIASRPEYWIRDTFETSPLPDITFPLSLRDDVDADKDIKAYLTDGFEKIRQDNRRIMQSVQSPWPPEYIVDRFVYEASGQYIYASTILKFVGNDSQFNDPQEQLKILLNSGPDRAPAFTELDRLYQTVLSVHRRWELMRRVLAGILMGVNQTFIRVLLGVPQTEITLSLDALSSLIDITPPRPLSEDGELLTLIFGSSLEDEEISFCHLSFREFLLDKDRSGLYHVDVATIHTEAINAFFTVICRNMDNNYETEPHISFNTSVLEYRRMMQGLVEVGAFWDYNIQELLPALNSMMERFRFFNPGRRMNYPACFMRDMTLLSDLLCWWNYREHNLDPDGEDDEEQDSNLINSVFAISNQLRDFALMARTIGIHLLSLSDGFSITRALFCIGHWRQKPSARITIQELLKIPGNTATDTLSTIRKHRHIIELRYKRPKNMEPPAGIDPSSILSFMPPWMDPASMFLVDLPERLDDTQIYWPDWSNNGELIDLKATVDVGWLCRREWENQHVLLVCDCLKSVMIHLDNGWEHIVCASGFWNGVNVKNPILEKFFGSDDLSDIRGEGYFENKYHISLLEIMADSEAWIAVLPLRPKLWTELDGLISPILDWFDRQLTNPTAIKLMEEHDVFLPQKLTTAMNSIFQHCFIPVFRTPYFSDLVISTLPEEDAKKTVRLKAVRSNLFEVEAGFIPCEDHRFSVPDFLMRQDPPPPIPTSEWYTCYSAFILNTTVKDLYRQTHPEFGQQEIWQPYLLRRSSKNSSTTTPINDLLFEFLQYAQTTPQNLDALRAIKHLYGQVDHKLSWFGTWPRFICPFREFLKEYEPPVLGPDELSDFEYWFRDIEESYEPMIPSEEKQPSTSSKELWDLDIDWEVCIALSTSVDADP